MPDHFTKNTLRPPIQRNDSEQQRTSLDIVRSGIDSRKNAAKERRHQIPGLQTSPYLKIYVIRCDDKDTYKESERKQLREWIRDNAASSDLKKGKSENHDAFEWLILHVVVPDTIAASEPRWRTSEAKDSDELKERKQQSVNLPGKSTRTVFDKLRADFNESGGQDRVAQIRLLKNEVPPDLLPTPAVAMTLKETAEERDKSWNDLMTKLKNLILGPFDMRVRQYEADIAGQESRRSLPGFNFCTFFIHKEGLAKALESIGLVEDALVIYDELSLGLETVLRDLTGGKAEGTATTFAPYTEDIQERIIGSHNSEANGTSVDDATSHVQEIYDYREKIVRSSISVFDFFSYLFSRQKAIILRLANTKAVQAQLGSSASKEGGGAGEDLVLTSEVCWRAMSFIHNNARVLRQDLLANRSDRAPSDSDSPKKLSDNDIEALVCSWTYTVAGRVLEETASSALEQPSSEPGRRRESLSNGTISSPPLRRADFHGLGANAYPQRTTSLPARKSRVKDLQNNRNSLQSASETDLMSPPSSSGTDSVGARPASALPGLPELVTYRAELVMMQRKMVELVARQKGWMAGWASVRDESRVGKMEEVDLNGEDEPSAETGQGKGRETYPSDLVSPVLASYLDSEETFRQAYERLSDQAMRYFLSATQTKTVETIMGDLAILRCQQGDHEYAAAYFQHVLPLYAEEGWRLMEVEALRVQAHCLKELGRKEEHVRVLLALVEKSSGRSQGLDETIGMIDIEKLLPQLVAASEGLESEVESPADQLFDDIYLDREVVQFDDKDGFALRLRFRYLLDEPMDADEVSVRLLQVDDPNQEIWSSSIHLVNVKPGLNHCDVESTTVTFGAYLVDRVVLKAKKLRFVHDLQPGKPVEEPTSPRIVDLQPSNKWSEAHKRPWVFLYPAQHAFSVKMSLARDVIINQPRFLEISLDSGWNETQRVEIKLKPASAGLRLHLADSIFQDVEPRDDEELPSAPGQINLGALEAHSAGLVKIPYSVEQTTPEIIVRLEAQYTTTKGSFVFLTSARLPNELPLDVDVNDIFHLNALFSNFTIRTTGRAPLSILGAELKPSAAYDVEAPPVLPMPMTVFERQPVKLVYKITRKASPSGYINKKEAALALSVRYHAVDELILEGIRKKFFDALAQSPYTSLERLLLPLLSERSKQLFATGDLEVAVLLNEARAPSYEDLGWDEVVGTLAPAIRPELRSWLTQWHEQIGHIAIDQGEVAAELQRCITISVEVPTVDFVHHASLSLLEQKRQGEHGSRILTLGQPIKAQLRLNSTRSWSSKKVLQTSEHDADDKDQSQKFVFDIQADLDSWLVGGQRRCQFTAKEGAELTFNLSLIPLRLGAHALPLVDVQAERIEGNTESGTAPAHTPAVSCETHYASAGQVVQVIRDTRTARVHIPEPSTGARPPSRPGTATTTKEAG